MQGGFLGPQKGVACMHKVVSDEEIECLRCTAIERYRKTNTLAPKRIYIRRSLCTPLVVTCQSLVFYSVFLLVVHFFFNMSCVV